jgi:epoxyqueuosine reductase
VSRTAALCYAATMLANAFPHGEEVTVIPVERLATLKGELLSFVRDHDLNDFQRWVVTDLCSMELPSVDFTIRSIILIAIPHPMFAHVDFEFRGAVYRTRSLVASDFAATSAALERALSPSGYHAVETDKLPLKRLAVHSGMARYGRNNVCYIDGLGSCVSLVAYLSDGPAVDNHWSDVKLASICTKCTICVDRCPTGAIRSDRFPIDTDRCLSYWNEGPNPFPDWMSITAHNCVYDCLECQIHCPMNKGHAASVPEPVHFYEAETEMLLSGTPLEEQPESMQEKVRYLGIHFWPDGIPRNLRVLFDRGSATT